ncbi:MAG: phosphate signaling complex protein PhoU [Candidatus Omnitrophica bacterium]|nr:phosphate signaling complex protein PhoU [Candidatus Omnitrophota bacterium]
MKRHLDDELKKLKDKLFKMGLLVEEALDHATAAVFERDSAKAEAVLRRDQEINLYEIEIDELGHELIALYQPAAIDLRLITMVLKITNDLERMGDQAVNIAEKAMVINQEPPLKTYQDELHKMAEVALKMVRDSLNAFMEKDHERAKAILEEDDVIDRINDQVYENLQKMLGENPEKIRVGLSLIMISHNLERVADLATNIAEDVIYLKRGIDVRHHIRERREDKA